MKKTTLSINFLIAMFCLLFFVAAASAQDDSADSDSSTDDTTEDMSGDDMSEPMEPEIELQEPVSLLVDRNGDEVVSIAAFGDSITRGVGDFTASNATGSPLTFPSREAGDPLRVEQLLGVPVDNLGRPGERFSTDGLLRFAGEIPFRRPDIVTISGGSNDAIDMISVSELGRAIQTAVNIAREEGAQPVLLTTPPVCCDHSGFIRIIDSYNREWRTRAAVNEVPLVDIERAYSNTCNVSSCFLINRPEGLHPNSSGYDVSGEMVAATLLGISLLEPNGPATLESVLMLTPGSVQTVPNLNFSIVPEES